MTKALIIEAPYYTDVASLLREGAQAELNKTKVPYDIITVPGALEIPAALNFSLNKKYALYIVLGCVIRGETSHYDIVCHESARGVYDLVIKHGLALGNAIVTVENIEQAIIRSDPAQKDKGGAAARAALRMLQVKTNPIFENKSYI